MSYYFTILSPTDVPLFSLAFGTSKAGGDGIARFRFADTARYMNQFIVHSSLDIVEEIQWTNSAMYLKHVDTYPPMSAHISAFLTATGARFLLLHQPPQPSSSVITASGSGPLSGSTTSATSRTSSSIANNPTSPQTEEAIRQFMNEVYENWVKTVMNPFYRRGMEITSPVFRSKVISAGRKWL